MSYCGCDPYDAPEWMRQKQKVLARKSHVCNECRCTIRPGERYEYVVGKWDGDVLTFKTCERCVELDLWMSISYPCFCRMFGSLLEDVHDCVRDIVSDCPPGFFMEYGRRAIKIRRRSLADKALRKAAAPSASERPHDRP